MSEALLTAREVAIMMRLTPATVYNAAKSGRIPCIVIIKGTRRDTIRFRRADIEALLNQKEVS
jgi:predicted DNA-binding transcriptional regulator AlpA